MNSVKYFLYYDDAFLKLLLPLEDLLWLTTFTL